MCIQGEAGTNRGCLGGWVRYEAARRSRPAKLAVSIKIIRRIGNGHTTTIAVGSKVR